MSDHGQARNQNNQNDEGPSSRRRMRKLKMVGLTVDDSQDESSESM
jgi:hypothetical protein